MKVISYKVFENSKDFEQWQKENPETGIISVSPFAGNIRGIQNGVENHSNFCMNVPITVFVTYFKEV